MNVLVNGVGNIGSTVLNILISKKDSLGINTVYALKNTPQPWNSEELEILQEKGVIICSTHSSKFTSLDAIKNEIDYVFDCTNNGGGMKNKSWYQNLPNLKGACAQGSEKNFGKSHMLGINDESIWGEKFVHIVSCNTHAIASIVSTLTEGNYNEIDFVDFVIVRRSEDIGNHQRLVSANVVARHLDSCLGTHHSIDVLDLYKTINVDFNVTSSDITTPSQLMHGVRFSIRMKNEGHLDKLSERIENNELVASTVKFDSNVIFELGRRYGFNGRIFSHAVIIDNNTLETPTEVKGWAFIPQEGNTILSTINAFLQQTKHPKTKEVMLQLKHDLLRNSW